VTVRGADVTGIELKLSPKSSIAGKVVSEPLPQRCKEKSVPAPEEIVLRAHRDEEVKTPLVANLFSPRDATADEKGEFTIKPLVPARYRLHALMPGENWYLKSITAPAPAPARGAAPSSGADIGRSGVILKFKNVAPGKYRLTVRAAPDEPLMDRLRRSPGTRTSALSFGKKPRR